LDHFNTVADEIIIVRAIGNQKPDKTLTIAKKRGCRTSEYFNAEGNEWPHVDDFGSARNAACDMATGDWLMWADTDDVITPDSIAQIRRLIDDIDSKPADGVLMRYVVPEDGVVNWRERLWRKGKARWQNPIHECLLFNEGSESIRFDAAEIVHASDKRSASRDERNLRILETIPEDNRTVSQKFHVFQSLIALDRNNEAIPKAMEFVQLDEVGTNERYEAFFQLARLAADQDDKKAMLLQALSVDPCRREAYGELALACMPAEPAKSLGYTEAMLSLSIPAEAPWNLRRAYYGYLGISLRAMALRVNDRREEADAIETNHFVRNGAKISLLHATRGRPGMAWRNRMEWLRMASNPDAIEHIFAIDADDTQSHLLTNSRSVVTAGTGGCVEAWNVAARESKGEILIQMSDDFAPFQGWDEAIISAIGDTSKPRVLAVSDGNRTDDLLCMAILTRKRYWEQGYLFHPEFFSMFSDNWFSDQAFTDDVVIDARGSITFEHLHPAFNKGEMDETYARSNDSSNYERGSKTFGRLKAGITLARDIEGWCDYSTFYRALAQSLPAGGKFVEIGSWMGQSISFFCQELQDAGKEMDVYCVDTFKGEQNQPTHLATVEENGGSILEVFERNTTATGVRDMIEVIQGDSSESAAMFDDGSLDAVYIDAAHDYDSVVKDMAAWYPKLKPSGVFCGHDYPWHEVGKAVDEHAAANGYKVDQVGRVWIKAKESK